MRQGAAIHVTSILILKTGALGDVLRTTSILPGLHGRFPGARVEWLTAPAARQLVDGHPLVARTHLWRAVDAALAAELRGQRWDWVLSLDDEEPLCRLASGLDAATLSGAHIDPTGERAYTDDVAPWFDMGLLSRLGKAEADRLKIANERSHPAIYADMFGVAMGRPELPVPSSAIASTEARLPKETLAQRSRWIGLNTGAGGRWTSKQLPEERTLELAQRLHTAANGDVGFVVLGGPDEAPRNARLVGALAGEGLAVIDAGTDNSLLEFAAIVDRLDLLVTSDSLALHIAIARSVPIVSFFSPTSAAEIELYGLGEAVRSTAPDYCSYRPDADNATVTAERLAAAVGRVLGSTAGRIRE